jgi:hypothetical protein
LGAIIMTAFTNKEERQGGLADRAPWLLETRLREQGTEFEAGPPWASHVVIDGHLVTGQNPASSRSGRIDARCAHGPTVPAVLVRDDGVTVDAYIDFLCPYCKLFEETSGLLLGAMVADGSATVIYHPMGFLDGLSTTRSSSRAAAAFGCASDLGKFPNLHRIARPCTPLPAPADRR